MDELAQLSNMIGDLKEKLTDKEYLDIMNGLKEVSKLLLSSAKIEELRQRLYPCAIHVICDCSIEELIDQAIDRVTERGFFSVAISRLICERYGVLS